jgi:hypothetical protein
MRMANTPKTTPKRPRDLNRWAKRMVDIATCAVKDREPTPEEQGKDPAAVASGLAGGLKGGKAHAEKLSPAGPPGPILYKVWI